MGISINNNPNVPQPQMLLESSIQIQTENMAIDGSLQRNRIGSKKQATLSYDMISPSDYQTLMTYFSTGSGVYYSNNQSGESGGIYTFSGLPYYDTGEYVKGSSLYRRFTVRIREQ